MDSRSAPRWTRGGGTAAPTATRRHGRLRRGWARGAGACPGGRLPLVPPAPPLTASEPRFTGYRVARWRSRPRSAPAAPTRPSGPSRWPRAELDELLELARWAPNHNLTNPWRFRVVGPRALERLKEAAGPEAAGEARPRPDPGRLLVRPRRRPGPGRGGPARDRRRRLHRPARRPRPRPRRLLAHARVLRTDRRARRGRASATTSASSACIHLGQPVQEQGAARAARRSATSSPTSTDRDALPRRGTRGDAARTRFDVVVIGGGITGAGVALDAASRGYSVALLERDDYAVGTSSRSSKMVHGGLRYLQNFDLGLVREALLERQLMVQLAPHLVYPTPVPGPDPRRGAPRPRARHRAEHVRRDGDDAGRPGAPRAPGARALPRARASDEDDYWAPDRHRTIDGEEAAELVPALGRPRSQATPTSSTTARPTTSASS